MSFIQNRRVDQMSRSRLQREKKLFPTLIFSIEQHEHLVMKVAKVVKVRTGLCVTLKRLVCYFAEGGVVL